MDSNGSLIAKAYRYCLLGLLGLIVTGSCYAFDESAYSDGMSLQSKALWFKDEGNQFSFDDVKEWPISAFNAPINRAFSDGYDRSSYWFRFELNLSPTQSRQWLLELPFGLLDFVTLYMPDGEGGYSHLTTGDRLPFEQRPLELRHFVFPLPTLEGPQVYFLKVETQDSVQVPLVIWPSEAFHTHYAESLIPHIGYFGAMLVMIIYNLLIYFSTRDRNYLFYVAFISLMGLFQLGLQGFSHQWLWPNSPWWSNVSIPLFGVLSLLCGLLFVRHLLNTRETLPRFDKTLRFVSYSMLVTVPLILFADYDLAIDASLVVTSIFFNLTLVAIILLALKGDRTAKILLVAWSIFLVSGSISMLGIIGYLPLEFAGTQAIQIGSAIEVVLLSLALADRIKMLRSAALKLEVQAKDYLTLSNESLAKSNRLKDAFIATISHEIKTPMNAILGSAQLLRKEGIKAELRGYLDIIEHSGTTLVSILDNVLEYSKLEAGKISPKVDWFTLSPLFESLEKLFVLQMQQKRLRFWITSNVDISTRIESDPLLFKQVAINLVSNAMKFTHNGYVWLHVEVQSHQIELKVEDSGIGMTDEQLSKLFSPFSQADDSTSREYGGTGLGLVISRKICQLLGGEITVDSTFRKGTEFIATIPCQSNCVEITKRHPYRFALTLDREQQLAVARFSTPSDCAGTLVDKPGALILQSAVGERTIPSPLLRSSFQNIAEDREAEEASPNTHDKQSLFLDVLAVDDDGTNQMIIGKILKHIGVRYKVVGSGAEAIEAYKHRHFDVILMDIEMPKMDGFETTQKIREIESTDLERGQSKIFALSAHTKAEFSEKAIASGMNDFLSKPVNLKDLKVRLSEISQQQSVLA